TKNSISDILEGFQYNEEKGGIRIYKVKGWDYAGLVSTFQKGIAETRETHIPVVFHVQEVTQPQGHSTSGSHERYKSAERLEWEKEYDCLKKMREFLLEHEIATEDQLEELDQEAKAEAREGRQKAWNGFLQPIKNQV